MRLKDKIRTFFEGASRAPLSGLRRLPKWVSWTIGGLAVLFLVLIIAAFFIDEPLRKYTENNLNRHLKGYSVRLPALSFHPIGLSVTLKDLTVYQNKNPNPPIATFPVLRAGLHWRALLSGRLVGEFRFDRPNLHINLVQLKSEAASKVKFKDRGWQQAAEDVYPLKINLLRVNDAQITYIDQDPQRPLNLSRLSLQAENIRNVHSADRVYPSRFHMETDIFGKGHGVLDGMANFLAEPFPGVKGSFRFRDVPLEYFRTIIARSNLSIEGGVFSTYGDVEYSPAVKNVHIGDIAIKGMKVFYIHSAETAAAEKRRAEKVKQVAKKAGKQTETVLKMDHLALTDCTIGMINADADPKYRVFLSDLNLSIKNLTNKFSHGPAQAKLNGRFMGSGPTTATANFRPEVKGPDFDVHVEIRDTDLRTMNDLLRAYGKFDVAAGVFSFFAELRVKNNRIEGYIKPFFNDMKVYDRRQDKEKGLFRKMYEMLVGGVAHLLENRRKGDVATKAEVSGRLDNPELNTWQVIVELVRNAFFKAILPGFERQVTGGS